MILLGVLLTIIMVGFLAYNYASLPVWSLTFVVICLMWVKLLKFSFLTEAICFTLVLAVLSLLNIKPLRRRVISQPALNFFRAVQPDMSATERDAIAAGTIDWEADLFTGHPDWDKLLQRATPSLSVDEQAFLDGPVTKLCAMIDDWHFTHKLSDLSAEVWDYIKSAGFLGLIIPQAYGGKGFSQWGHAAVLIKLYSRSLSVASTVTVPNSLGPAELLLNYGTQEQKDHYLPRLAKGEEIPCFALTGPNAGSDAAALRDTGIICRGQFAGEDVLGIKLTWNKRYITLAPVATVLGLAFRLYDPDHLLGDTEELGITCALIPTDLPGISIGRRHFPLNICFMNGPTQGKDVFVPLSFIIGGAEMAGQGWRMLMECLGEGRGISLPSGSIGGCKAATSLTGAYARIRKQFNVPIGYFEGIEEPLARMAGLTYINESALRFVATAVDQGAKPAVASAIVKYHTTENARIVTNAAMDIQGGKAICLGPRNNIGRGYQGVPIGITVEGANILTRSLIIFGQGAIRCHPYVIEELEAAKTLYLS